MQDQDIYSTEYWAMEAHTDDISKGWIYPAQRGWGQADVQEFCVRDAEWQKTRLSMKGKSTATKLAILLKWRDKHVVRERFDGFKLITFRCEVQIDNYLGALRRGGQLDDNNMIKKYI